MGFNDDGLGAAMDAASANNRIRALEARCADLQRQVMYLLGRVDRGAPSLHSITPSASTPPMPVPTRDA